MALDALAASIVVRLNRKELRSYFYTYARYDQTSPNLCYVIRVGSQTLFSNDTRDLLNKLITHVDKLKRRVQYKKTTTVTGKKKK